MSDAFTAVTWLLDQEEPEARRVAVQQIQKVRGRQAAELLVRALGDDDWRVRKEAAYVAPGLEPRDETVAALIGALGERVNIGLRNAAVEALVAIGADAVHAAIDSLSKLDADGRKLAVEILGGVPDVRGTEALARVLADDDPNVRIAAAEALGNASLAGEGARELAISALSDVLSASEMLLKLAALDSLSRLDAKLPWKVFEPYANDPVLRRYAIAAAAGSRDHAAIATLARAAAGGSPTVAREAVIALGECVIGVYDDAALDAARRELAAAPKARTRVRAMAENAEDARARGAALLVLGLMGASARAEMPDDDLPILIQALCDDEAAERAELGLKLYGEAAMPVLLATSKRATPMLRSAIFSLVPSLAGGHVRELRETLRAALADASEGVLGAAVKALGQIGEAADLARVASFIPHEDPRLSTASANAAGALAGRFPHASRALLQKIDATAVDAVIGCILIGAHGHAAGDTDLSFLRRALAHPDARTRRSSVDALASIGGEQAGDSVAFALADEEREVQLAAMRALGRLGRAEPLINLVATARDPSLVVAALRALGDANPEKAFRAARPLVRSPDAAIACAAVEAIARLAGSTRLARVKPTDALFEALEHPDAEVVKVALSEIAAEPDARALARLGLCLDHSSWEVRRLAAELLGQDGSPGAQALLRARYEREKDPLVREALAAAVSVRPSAEPSSPVMQSGVTARSVDLTATLKPGERK